MPYDAAQLIASLPAEMRGTLVTSASQSATVGRASVSSSTLPSDYGDQYEYQLSLWFDATKFATPPTKNERVTFDGVSYFVLAVRTFPGNLRRLDLGGTYGR
jgi:hypothetical protein